MMLETLISCANLAVQIYRAWKDYGDTGNKTISEDEKAFVNTVMDNSSAITDKLLSLEREFVQKGDLESAQRVNQLIDERLRITEESYIILSSYLASDEFYRKL